MTSKNGYPYCDHCEAALVRFQWVDGYQVDGQEYWYATCMNCDKEDIRFVPAPPGCQRCGHAYLRKNHPPEKAWRYNYEACAMGVYPMVPARTSPISIRFPEGFEMKNLGAALWDGYDEDVIEFVNRGIEAADEGRFNELALRAFELQYRADEAYRKYCARTKIAPESISRWDEIPAVASFAFKKRLAPAFPQRKAEELYFGSRVAELWRKRGPFFRIGTSDRLRRAPAVFWKRHTYFPTSIP